MSSRTESYEFERCEVGAAAAKIGREKFLGATCDRTRPVELDEPTDIAGEEAVVAGVRGEPSRKP